MTFLSPTLQALYDVIPCHYISLSSYSEDLRVLHPIYLQPVFILSTEHNHLITYRITQPRIRAFKPLLHPTEYFYCV